MMRLVYLFDSKGYNKWLTEKLEKEKRKNLEKEKTENLEKEELVKENKKLEQKIIDIDRKNILTDLMLLRTRLQSTTNKLHSNHDEETQSLIEEIKQSITSCNDLLAELKREREDLVSDDVSKYSVLELREKTKTYKKNMTTY
jgi:hypothetical protein